jgi:hypothetical protein
VHHGSDLKYLDRNYGGTLIIWDRMFGSFQVEEEEPKYGITKQLASWNPLWATCITGLIWLVRAAGFRSWRTNPAVAEAARLAPQSYEAPVAPVATDSPGVNATTGKYDPRSRSGSTLCLVPVRAGPTIAVRVIDLAAKKTGLIELSILTGIVVVTLLCCGALLELKDWGFRGGAGPALLAVGTPSGRNQWVPISAAWLVVLLGGTVLSTFWLVSYRSEFGRTQSSVAAG